MNTVFYVSALVAVAATTMTITRTDAIHALLYLIVSLLAVSLVFFVLGAPLVAALEVIIYAGAIMVLFLFVVMMLNLGSQGVAQELAWLRGGGMIGPALLGLVLVGELLFVLSHAREPLPGGPGGSPEQVGAALFGAYLLGVEFASALLLAGLIGAYHLGRRTTPLAGGRPGSSKGTVPFSSDENRDSPQASPSSKGTVPFSSDENRDSPQTVFGRPR